MIPSSILSSPLMVFSWCCIFSAISGLFTETSPTVPYHERECFLPSSNLWFYRRKSFWFSTFRILLLQNSPYLPQKETLHQRTNQYCYWGMPVEHFYLFCFILCCLCVFSNLCSGEGTSVGDGSVSHSEKFSELWRTADEIVSSSRVLPLRKRFPRLLFRFRGGMREEKC